VRNKNILLLIFSLIIIKESYSQTMVMGALVSFAIADSNYNANAGGSMAFHNSQKECLNVQGGYVYGHAELFNKIGDFNDNCPEIFKELKIRVYPNPGNGEYWVEGEDLDIFEIYDRIGRLIYSKSNLSKDKIAKINISDQSEGSYFLKIRDISGQQHVYSIVKTNQ